MACKSIGRRSKQSHALELSTCGTWCPPASASADLYHEVETLTLGGLSGWIACSASGVGNEDSFESATFVAYSARASRLKPNTLRSTRFSAPLRWKRPQRIFVNSMSDLFHEEIPDKFIAQVWSVMRSASWHTYQILTKRPDRMVLLVPQLSTEPLPNVWLGTSIESSDYLFRLEWLRQTRAAIRFVSFEPLLGPIIDPDLRFIHWVIVGGESGPNARSISADWVRHIERACRKHSAAFFFKQWGGRDKSKNGRVFDGRTWDEYPVSDARVAF